MASLIRRSGKPGDIVGAADDGRGDDGADAEDLGEGGARSPDCRSQLLPGVPQPGIEVAQVSEELGGELFRVAAGDQLAQYSVEPADDLVAVRGNVTVPFGPDFQDRRMAIRGHITAAAGA